MSLSSLEIPAPFSSLPRYPLLFCPSPIQELKHISRMLDRAVPGRHVTIYAKREDLASFLYPGGNKTRKLEYLIADAKEQGADTLVSIGGIQSNHTRQVAAVAAHLGLECRLLQEHWVPGDDKEGYGKVGNLMLARMMGAKVTIGPAKGGNVVEAGSTGALNNFSHDDYKKRLELIVITAKEEGRKPYLIPAGASDHPLGGLGFARWSFELAKQEQDMGIFFDVIVVCAVTGSTMAGMVAGFKLLEKSGSQGKPPRRRRILGIDASAKVEETQAIVLRLARQTAQKIGLKAEDISEDDVELDGRYHADCYGIPDDRTTTAIRAAADTEALILDHVYEGKSFAGLLDMAMNKEFEKNSNVLFAHLGGQEALNSYPEIVEKDGY